jgi:GNAT superfamily N-acetyltransferase
VAVRIEAFDPDLHDTKDFRCGSDSQDNVLRRTAKRQQRDGYTRLYVAFLSHLAVDGRLQGKGLGRILLVDAMQQCQRAGQILGVRLMVLDVAGTAGEAERARLHSFYTSMGFRPLPGRPERLFLSLSALPPLQSGG